MVKFAEVSRVTGRPESGKLSEDVLPKLRPAGSVPAPSDQENGGVPPVAWMVCWYAVPTVPFATAEVVIVRGRAGVGIVGGAGGSWLAQPASQANGIIPRIAMCTLSISFQVPLPSKISSRSIAKYFIWSIKKCRRRKVRAPADPIKARQNSTSSKKSSPDWTQRSRSGGRWSLGLVAAAVGGKGNQKEKAERARVISQLRVFGHGIIPKRE